MSPHIIVTVLALGEWRISCGCGWRVTRKTRRVAFRIGHRHLDAVRAKADLT